jgi:chromosome partitioning protein
LGIDHHADIKSIYEVLIDDVPIEKVVQISPERPGLTCVPATIHLAGAEIELVSLVAREQRLRTAIETYLQHHDEPAGLCLD